MKEKAKRKRLEELYLQIPKIACRGLCADECTVIVMTRMEERIMRDAGHEPPDAMEVLRSKPPRCPLLCPATGRCTAYSVRPAVCRLFGLTPDLPCAHGCKAERMLTKEEGQRIMREIEDLGGKSQFLVDFF